MRVDEQGAVAQLDRANQAVVLSGKRVQLTPKAFAVLDFLHSQAGRLVAKDELLESVWPRVYVGDAVLKVAVREIRKALADDPRRPRYIETLHRRGYRFIGEMPLAGNASENDAGGTDSTGDQRTPHFEPDHTGAAFVARKTELEQLDDFQALALSGRRQLVLVSGDPGIGKTALLETWLAQNSNTLKEDILLAEGHCVEQHAGAEAYLPLLDALARLCKGPQAAHLQAMLASYAPSWLIQLPRLVEPDMVKRLQDELLGATRERMLREMAEFIEALTKNTPLILLLEDVHWSDFATLDLLAYLARREEPARILMLITFRPGDVARRDHPLRHMQKEMHTHAQCGHLALNTFACADVQSYLQARCPGFEDIKPLAAALHQRSAGHPLFVASAVDFLLARDLLQEHDGVWRLTLPLAEIEIRMPAQLQQILEHQQARLDHNQRRLLQCAALVGERFSAAAVAHLLDRDIVAIEDEAEVLVWDGYWLQNADSLEWPDGTLAECYRFRSALHRDFFYTSLPAARRRQFHGKLAFCLADAFQEQTASIAADLAFHFEHGAEYERAVEFLQLACGTDQARFAAHEALQHIEKAIALLRHLDEAQRVICYAALVQKRCELLLAAGQIEKGIKSYQELIGWARDSGAEKQHATALLGLASTFFWVDRQRCLELADEALECARRLDDTVLQSHIRGWHAHWNSLIRGFERHHISAYSDAVRMARQSGNKIHECQHLALNAYLCNLRSQYASSEKNARQGLQLAEALGDGQQYLVCQFFLAWALYYAGRWAEMNDVIDDAMAIADKNGHRPWQMHFQLQRAWLRANASDPQGAYSICTPILQQVKATGRTGSEFFFGLILEARIQLALNASKQAWLSLAEIERQLQQVPDSIDWILRLPLQLTLAEYFCELGDSARAQVAAERLIALASGPMDRTHLIYGHALLCEIALLEENESMFLQAAQAGAEVLQKNDAEVPLAALRLHLAMARFHDWSGSGESKIYRLRAKEVSSGILASLKNNKQLSECYKTHPTLVELLSVN